MSDYLAEQNTSEVIDFASLTYKDVKILGFAAFEDWFGHSKFPG